MKAVFVLLLTLCVTTSANAARVVSVGDGDTVRVSEGSKRITVRLACIDAPETAQRPWGARSTAFLKQLAPVGSEVTLREQTTDRYGRTVAELLNHRGNVNQLMVEAEANRQGAGVWSVGPSGITRPWDYRRGRTSSSSSSGSPRKYRCKDIGSWRQAQQLLEEGHRYLDGDGDGEACESLR